MSDLKRYMVPVELVVWGENPEDAVEYAEAAIDMSNLLDQDGILGAGIRDPEDVEPCE